MLFIIFFFAGGKRKGYQRIKTFLLFEYDNISQIFPHLLVNTQFLSLRYFSQILLIVCYFVYRIPDIGKESSWVKVFMVFYRLFKLIKKIKDIL